MDYLIFKAIKKLCIISAVFILTILCIPEKGNSQSSYEFLPAPDVWYNSVDGIRLGVRLRGQQPGSFGDGAHRLNTGVWFGTKIPENPISYYLSYVEPIPAISEFGSEANVELVSSYRTGFHNHGVNFNKRWQTGFDELNYKELTVGFRSEHRFNNEYLLYPQLWQEEWLYVASANFVMTDENKPGRYLLSFSTDVNLLGNASEFIRSDISYQQKVELSSHFTLLSRAYIGMASNQTAPEYLFSRSLKSSRFWMERGLTRARGTIPPKWIKSGNIQITGGPNLRGYTDSDINILNNATAPLYTSFSSLNIELDYPNPLDRAVKKMPVIGGLIDLRSYLFFDVGTSLGFTELEESRALSDAGVGFLFSIDIPDYLGKSRGIQLRYDIPFWLSNVGNKRVFEFRNVVAIGAIISI